LEKEWSGLDSMVTHHSVMQEMLPCTLQLSSDSLSEKEEDEDDEDDEEERDELSDEDNNQTDSAMSSKILMTTHRN
jgi:hypothetical protein